MKYQYRTKGTCSQRIEFEIEDGKIRNVVFFGGCDGNLKALSKLVEGMSPADVEAKLRGNTCGFKSTSCADQLAIALRQALEQDN